MRRSTIAARVALVTSAFMCVVAIAITATNVVPASRAGSSIPGAPTANQLKPAACSAISLTAVVTGAGTFSGTSAAELVLGSAGVDSIRGLGGNDCILGGDGNDFLQGDAGTDVCIGGAGTDTFSSTCETRIQ